MENKSYALFSRLLGVLILSSFIIFSIMTACKKPPVEPAPTPEPDLPEPTWISPLVFLPDSVIFNGNETKTVLMSLRDSCMFDGEAEYYIQFPYEWVDVQPRYGLIKKGDTVRLELIAHLDSVLFEPLIDEMYAGLEYYLDAIEAVATLIYQPVDQLLYGFSDTLYFPHGHNDVSFVIQNKGNVDFDVSITPSSNAVTLSENAIRVLVGEQKEISVIIDRESLMMDNNPILELTIGDRTDTIVLMVEKKQMLANDVIDAEYSKLMNVLVYVASDLTLNIYHPNTKAVDVVPLSYYPNCVSVSTDGTKAVVGHDAHVSCVDLQTKTVIATNDISCDALDIVMGNNGWAYVFPRLDQWCFIHCINMTATNQIEVLHTGHMIRSGTRAKIHPSGKYIYGAQAALSTETIQKYGIEYDTAEYLYEKTGQYSIRNNLWLTENGDRIITKGGSVLLLSETQDQDIVYFGKLQFEGSPTTTFSHIECFDHSELSRKFFALSQTVNYNFGSRPILPYVYVHDAASLAYLNKIRLEDYMIPNLGAQPDIYTAEPFFVFANSDGHEIYVLTKSIDSGLVNDWVVQTIMIN